MVQPLADMANILRKAGCAVVEYPGWKTRSRPWTFTPRGVVLHHDGSPKGPAGNPQAYAKFLFETGRPSEGIPGPLCQLWVDYYGKIWVGAAGGANHAGLGDGWGVLPKDQGNRYSLGIEMDNTSDEPTTPAQYDALYKALPAIFTAYGWNPANALCGHKEYAPGRKSDPDDIDMSKMRRSVADAMQHGSEDEDMTPDQAKQLDFIADQIRRAVGPGQKEFAGTAAATLRTTQATFNRVGTAIAAIEGQTGTLTQAIKDALSGLDLGALTVDEIAAGVVAKLSEELSN